MSRFVGVLVAALVAVILNAVAAPAHAGQDDWRFLYAGGDLRDGRGALKSEIRASISVDTPAARFSPSGTRLATPEVDCLDSQCDEVRGSVRIHKPDGTSSVLAWVPDFAPRAVAWSGNSGQVAVLGRTYTPGDPDIRIYLLPVNGSGAKLVYSDTQLLRIEEFKGLSWNSADNRLAFVASEFFQEEGVYYNVQGGTAQVWTVPAAASAVPSRFSGTPVCGDCSHTPGYTQPTWSPDGSRLAVVSHDPMAFPGEEKPPFVGYLDEGALAADKLSSEIPQDQMAWSHDGQNLAFGVYDTSGDFYDETVVIDADTGSRVAIVKDVIAPFVDWLPCPTGTCQVWQDVYVPPKPFLNIRGVARQAKVIVSGELGRVPEVASLKVTLDKRARVGAPWRRVTAVQVQAVEGLFRRSFARPARAVQCRARGDYAAGTARATDTVIFSC